MNCKSCGTENPEDAVYCKSCGRRVDGMTSCRACGKEISDDSAFCIYCGATVSDGYAVKPVKKLVFEEVEGEVNENPKWLLAKRVLKTVSASAALITALVALIFVFLIGVKPVVAAVGVSGSLKGVNLYYFFGKGYSNISDALERINLYYSTEDLLKTSLYVPMVLGTVIAAGTIVSVVTLSVMSIVYCIKSLMGKGQKSGGSFAIAAFMTFVIGSILLLVLQSYNISGDLNSTYTLSFNGATKAGIILGSVFAAVYFGCMIAARAKEFVKAGVLVKFVCSFVGIVLLIVVLTLLANPIYGANSDTDSDISIRIGLMGVIYDSSGSNFGFGILSLIPNLIYDIEKKNVEAVWGEVAAVSVVAFIVMIILIIIAVCTFIKHLDTVTGEGKTGTLKFNIVTTVLALIFMVLALVNASLFVKAEEYLSNMALDAEKLTSAIPIAVFVISAIALAGSITETCLAVKYDNQ